MAVSKERTLNKRASAAAARKKKDQRIDGSEPTTVVVQKDRQRGSRHKRTKEGGERVVADVSLLLEENDIPSREEEEGYDTCEEIDVEEEVQLSVGTNGGVRNLVVPVEQASVPVVSSAMQLLEKKILELEDQNRILKEKAARGRGGGGDVVLDMMSKRRKTCNLEYLFLQRHDAMLIELRSYVASKIFPFAKFPVDSRVAKAICINAVDKFAVVIPKEATKLQFANAYYKVIGARLKHARVNCQTGARIKYIGEWW